jgi:hypothetical protein
MAVKSVYNKYFQKSKVFLYPLLGIKKGVKVVPSETYIAWKPFYIPEDVKLVCLYHPNKSNEYEKYEKEVLLKHNRLCDIKEINAHSKIFVFDFNDLKDDWEHFMNGKYSKISDDVKNKILDFFDKNTANYIYIKSYLYPEKYFSDYAECLAVDIDMLKKVGELCGKPDFEKETLAMDEVKKEIIN